ncbi:MAG: hypothetical protein RI967_2561, partial [Planctomycetota bacterium]
MEPNDRQPTSERARGTAHGASHISSSISSPIASPASSPSPSPMPAPILALDCGTTSVRAIVFSPDGEELASAQREFAQHFPAPGLVEHDASEIWEKTLACARDALAAARETHGVHPEAVAAIGITNQRE